MPATTVMCVKVSSTTVRAEPFRVRQIVPSLTHMLYHAPSNFMQHKQNRRAAIPCARYHFSSASTPFRTNIETHHELILTRCTDDPIHLRCWKLAGSSHNH